MQGTQGSEGRQKHNGVRARGSATKAGDTCTPVRLEARGEGESVQGCGSGKPRTRENARGKSGACGRTVEAEDVMRACEREHTGMQKRGRGRVGVNERQQ